LAKKLKECGVFGVASDEYLNYAEQNRAEWESKGEEQVEMYIQRYHEECAAKLLVERKSKSTSAPLLTSFEDISLSSTATAEWHGKDWAEKDKNEECAANARERRNSSTTATQVPSFDEVSLSSAATVEVMEQSEEYRHYVKRGCRHCDV
jgi:hypothetical protein